MSAPSVATRPAQRSRLAASVSAGVLCGALVVVFATSYAALIFSGPLTPYLGIGLGMALFGAAAQTLVLSARSSYAGTVGGVSSETAILGVIITGVAAMPGMSASPETLLAIAVLVVTGSALAMGALCVGLGRARLGNLIRSVPYPVMGGFVAGVGWLLLEGGLRLALAPLDGAAGVAALLEPPVAQHWAPPLIAALALLLQQRHNGHFLGVPAMVVVLGAGVYATGWANGEGVADLMAGGWLLGPASAAQGWSVLHLIDAVGQARWMPVVDALPGIVTFAVTSVIGLLLVGAALEVTVREDVDLNRELRAAGWANLIAAAGGGFSGYHYIGSTGLNHQMGADSRLVGLIAGGICVLVLLAGSDVLVLLPRAVAVALLFFMGLNLLLRWLVESVTRVTRVDYLVIVTVFAFVVAVGFMEGVLIGLILGIALFVLDYARIDVVKRALTASSLRSSVLRPRAAQRLLREVGDRVSVYRLEGFIFFGTINRLLERIRERADTPRYPLHTVILDFRNVRGMDSSAAMYFGRLPSLARRRGFELVTASISPQIWTLFEREGLREERRLTPADLAGTRERRVGERGETHERVLVFRDLDAALQWTEDRLLEDAGFDESSATVRSMEDSLFTLFARPDVADRFGERRVFEPGEALAIQGMPFSQLHFIVSGTVSVDVRMDDGEVVRLRTMGAGSCVGEVSMYLGGAASANVEALQRTQTLSLSRDSLERMRREAPDAHARLHQALAQTLAARLADTTRVLDILLH